MSVALIITDKKEENNTLEYLPIAGEKTFEDIWLSICKEGNFSYIPLFQTGIVFELDDMPFILAELERFKILLQKEQLYLLDRVEPLIEVLNDFKDNTMAEFFIG